MNFPSDVYKWMKINAKPKMALNLMKVCKYFRHSDGFPYLVVKRLYACAGRFSLDTLDGKTISTENLETVTQKLWIAGNIQIYGDDKVVSTLLRKTAVCDIQIIQLVCQQITFDEYKLLTDGGMVEEFLAHQITITFENSEIIPLDDIFECLPNARVIYYSCKIRSLFTLETPEATISSKLEKLGLYFPTNNFDFERLFAYMKNHQKVKYSLWFGEFLTEEFAENVAPYANKMIQQWSPEYKKPEVLQYPFN